jgi:hypothetical protein
MQSKGIVRQDADIQVREEVSPVENFLYLNKLAGNARKIVPLTSSQQPFVAFSERDLALFSLEARICQGQDDTFGCFR